MKVWQLTLLVAVIAAALVPVVFDGRTEVSGRDLLALTVAFALAEALVVHLQTGRQAYSYSLSEIPLVVGLAYASPATLLLARVAGSAFTLAAQRRQPLNKLTFNVANLALEAVLAVALWDVVLGHASPTSPRGWAAALVTCATVDALGTVLIAAAVGLQERRLPVGLLREVAVSGPVATALNASVAVVVVTLLAVDWRAAWTVAVLIGLLFLAQRTYDQLRRRTATLEYLQRFSRQLAHDPRLITTGEAVLRQLRGDLNAELAELQLWSSFTGREPMTLRDEAGEHVRTTTSGWGEGSDADPSLAVPSRRCTATLAPRRTRDPALAALLERRGVRDLVMAPIVGVDGQGPVGCLLAADHQGDVGTFTREDLLLLQALADYASVSLRNAALTDDLRRQVSTTVHQAQHDALTGLPNRTFFRDQVSRALRRTRPVSVLLVDLDQFKHVNDTLGHRTGDELLQRVGARLEATLPQARCIARLGGDEFGVLLPGPARDGLQAAERVVRTLQQPLAVGELSIAAAASIGVATSPDHGSDVETLMQHADVAMYEAKRTRSGIEGYDPRTDTFSEEHLALAAGLGDALRSGQLVVQYQPKVRLHDRQLIGVEALVRWRHPALGLLPPGVFIPIADQAGLMGAITAFVLQTSVLQREEWARAGLPLQVAVNISPRDLLGREFVTRVRDTLDASAMAAEHLTLEITEDSLMLDAERAVGVLGRLADLGVQLAVDDLGTGHSSLAYLKALPVREIKIDRSFVTGMADDPRDEVIIGAVVEMARGLDKTVVAEGVENDRTWRALRRLGCDAAQGYWMSRAIDPADLFEWARVGGAVGVPR